MAVLGEDTPVRSITRAHCRDLIEAIRCLPRNASKRYPGLSPVEAAAKAREVGDTDLISPANLNAYLNKLGGVFNWAVKEEMIDRNPAQGLRVPDPILRRDKRHPFSTTQLQAIFSAPLYTGCRDDGHGYAVPGDNRPRNARFWIPLIGLYCGLRLNEACQLDVSDVRIVEEIDCIVVTEASESFRSRRTRSRILTPSTLEDRMPLTFSMTKATGRVLFKIPMYSL
jgi:integrase